MIKFKFCGIIFEISFLLICFLTLILIYYGERVFLCSAIAMIFHEFCHLILLLLFKDKPRKIRVLLSGFAIFTGRELSNWQNFFVLSAGVLGNLFLFFMFFSFKFFALINLVLVILNILPHEKFDGGQLLELVLQCKFDVNLSIKILKICSFCVSFLLFLLGLCILFKFYNFTLLAVVFMLVFSN